MRRGHWAEETVEKLRRGQSATARPVGHSMKGCINDGDVVHLAPCNMAELAVGDVVLAEIEGRKYRHVVLHKIVERDGEKFLIGAENGRIDGWVTGERILGRVVEVLREE